MKKIIFIIVIIVVIVGLLKILGVKTSVSLKSPANRDDEGIYPYQLMSEGNSYKDIIGTSLPKRAADICGPGVYCCGGPDDEPTTYKYNWVVATLPKEDFYDLVEQLNLTQRSDLLGIWPEAFECQLDKFRRFWDVTTKVTEDAYFAESLDEETYRLFKYENGKLYIKKVTTYIAFRNEKNEVLYKKVKKGQSESPN